MFIIFWNTLINAQYGASYKVHNFVFVSSQKYICIHTESLYITQHVYYIPYNVDITHHMKILFIFKNQFYIHSRTILYQPYKNFISTIFLVAQEAHIALI